MASLDCPTVSMVEYVGCYINANTKGAGREEDVKCGSVACPLICAHDRNIVP